MTTALEGGEWSAARPGRTLPPGKTRYPFYRRLGGPQGRSGRAENLVPTGIRSRTVRTFVSRYTDWATRPTGIFLAIHCYIQSEVRTMCIIHCQNLDLSFVTHIITYSLTTVWYEPKHEAVIGCLKTNDCPWPVFTCFFPHKTMDPIRTVFPGPVPFVTEMYRCPENFLFSLSNLLDFSFPMGRSRRRWVDNIRTDLQEVGCGYMDWIGLAQDKRQVADACECGNEPSGSVKCGEYLD